MMEGTAAELGLDGRYLAHMRRRGEAEIIGRIRTRHIDACIWRILKPPTVEHPGDLFRVYRNEMGLSQSQLADELEMEQSALASIERGTRGPCTMSLYTFLNFSGVMFAEFFARLKGIESPPRLKQMDSLPMNQATMAAMNASGVKIPRQYAHSMRKGSTLSYKTINRLCAEAGFDHIELWRQVDCRLRWTK